VTGVDLARGLALLGMMAKHVFDDVTGHGPTATGLIASGRAATTFALVAGVSIAFLSGGRRILHGRARTAAAAGLAVRALLIGTIGLLLGLAGSGIELILVYYAVFFLLTIPLLGLRPRTLALLSVAFAALGPVLLFATDGMNLPYSGTSEPTPITLATEPLALLVQTLVTGDYPAVVYMAFVCAGLAIGRLDLTSRRVAGGCWAVESPRGAACGRDGARPAERTRPCGSPTPRTCGGRTPSSTASTSRPTWTGTATAAATSRASPSGSTTSPTSG
jgi:uncharacterized membrane protein